MRPFKSALEVLSAAEKRAILSLAAALVAWSYFAMRMLDGYVVVDQSAGMVLTAFVGTVVGLVVLEALISAVLAARQEQDGGAVLPEGDERDVAIAARAGRVESAVVIAGINIVVIQMIASAAWPGHTLPVIDLTRMPTLVFWLVSILFAGHVGRLAATLVLYRQQA
jgi:hypothetical protein